MATQVEILSNSLALLGHAAITTLTDPDEITTAAIQAYDMLLPGVLSRNNWRFAIKIADMYREEYLISSVNSIGNVVTATNSNFSLTEPHSVRFETTESLPVTIPTISTAPTYYALGLTANTFNVFETYQEALAGELSYVISAVVTTTVTAIGSSFNTNEPTTVYFTTTGTLPASAPVINATTAYYSLGLTNDTFKVYPTAQDALDDTNAISFSTIGTGINNIVKSSIIFTNIGTGTNKIVKVANPDSQWKSIYPLPSDYLKTIRMHPQNYQFEIFRNKIYSTGDNESLTMEYVYQPLPTELPIRFIEYFVYEIAAYLALSNAQRPDFYQVLEGRRQQAFAMASAIEAQNRPQNSQASFPMLDARNVTLLDLPNSLS